MIRALYRALPALSALVLLMLAPGASAQTGIDFDLPAQPLADSLRAIASRTSTNVLFDRSLVAQRTAPALQVHATLDRALELILAGTGLTYRYLGENTVTIVSRPSGDSVSRRPTGHAIAKPSNSGEQGLEEIIVTAERRSVGMQDVAASVAAFTPEILDKSGIWSLEDLQLRTPGLLISNNGTYGQPYLRGVGSDIINPGADSPIAVFIDGAYQARQTAALTELFDLERIEILKGPQGTLYGRNASGGAINVLTHDPDPFLAAAADVVLGNYDTRRVRAMINAPLADGWALRVAGLVSRRDGYTRNTYNGTRLDDEDVTGLRAKLKYDAGGSLSVVVGAEYGHESDARNNPHKVLDTPALPLPVRDLAAEFGYAPPTIPADPFVVEHDFQPGIHQEQLRLNATARMRFGDLEGAFISGYTRVTGVTLNDLDATAIDFSYDREAGRSRALTQSLQLSPVGAARLSWIAGVEHFDERSGQNFDARLPLFGPPSLVRFGADSSAPGFIWSSSLRTHAVAAFVDGSFALSKSWTVAAGIRYSWEEKRADFLQTIIDPLGDLTGVPGTMLHPAQPGRGFGAWTPKVRVEYRPASRVLLYAAATRGFKSGGFNLMNTGEVFQPEKIWSLESGIKATWLDNRLRTNAAAFCYDYRDLQVNQFSGVTNLVTNAATSRVTGLEMEMVAAPVPWIQADLGMALLDARYHRYLMLDANNPQVTLDLSGNRMPHAPRATLIAGVEAELGVAGRGRLTLRGEARYQSLMYFDQLDTLELTQGGFALFNARAFFTPADARWNVALFGANLANKVYRQSIVRVDNVFGTEASFGAPRTFGIQLGTRF